MISGALVFSIPATTRGIRADFYAERKDKMDVPGPYVEKVRVRKRCFDLKLLLE